MMASPSKIQTYFQHRISYYESPKCYLFPERHKQIVPLYMTEKMELKYVQIEKDGPPHRVEKEDSTNPNAFF